MKPKKQSPAKIVNIFRNSSLFAIVFTASSIAIVVSYIEFLDFQKRAEIIESEYVLSQKDLIKQEVLKVTDYIALKRAQVQEITKKRIKNRVYEAHAIAHNIFNKFNGKSSDNEIKLLIIEALRPLRFFNGDGYYFINNMEGVSLLHALRPDFEGINRLDVAGSTERIIVESFQSLIHKSDEGFLSYEFPSFKNTDLPQSKTTFIKQFKPYDWYIGTGDYINNIEILFQQEMKDYIEQVRFGKNSYIFVVNYQGEVVMNASQKHLIGKNIWNTKDPNGVMVVHEERRAVENPEGDFIYYVWNKPSTSTPSPKVSFMKSVPDWEWMIGAGVYLDDIEQIIQQQRGNLKRGLVNQVLYITLISFLIGLLIIRVTHNFSRKLSAELSTFLNFFKTLATKSEMIEKDSLRYIEFRELATSANQMLSNQILIEKERTQAEELLRASESSLKDAQRIAGIGSWENNFITGKSIWSDEMFRILDIENNNSNVSYQSFIDNIHPDDLEYVVSAYTESSVKKTPYDIEYRIKLKNDNIKFVREHGTTFYGDENNAIRTTGTIQDITDKKLQDEKIRHRDEQIKRTQKMDALGKLTGGIAHDYNNMLGVITGFSELLVDKTNNDPASSEYVKHIIDAAERGNNLTRKLMTFSKHNPAERKVIDLNAEILQQKNLLEKTLTARINLNLDLTNDIWPVMIDGGDFVDAIINMTINSSHAIKTSGNVSLTTRNEHISSTVANSLDLDAGDYVLLSFADTGIGLDDKTINQIFDPFFSTKGEKGTGLGLSQVYGFAQRSGGIIKVESNLGHGTEFTFYFPRYYSDKEKDNNTLPDNQDITSPNISDSKGKETILVVDDESALRILATAILSGKGYKVLTAEDAAQALHILETNHVDLMLSDIIMPNMDGYQLAAKVAEKHPNIIIQLVSGFSDNLDQFSLIDKQHNNLLLKPYSIDTLLTRIRKLLDKID